MLHGLLVFQLVAAPPPADLEKRLKELENEVQKLKLQSGEEPETAPAPSTGPVSPNLFNPTITGVGNGLFRYDSKPVYAGEDRIDRTFNVREFEVDLRAAVDPFADGVIILAFPSEVPGEFSTEVEEGYVTIKSLPIPIFDEPPLGLKLKVGRFRTDVGRVNRLHLHDLPQSIRPLVSDELWGDDGYIGNGISAQVFLPSFDEESAIELTAQVMAGGGVPVADGSPRVPAFVGNLRWFRTFAGAHNLDLAFVVHWGKTADALSSTTLGGDLLYKWKPLRRGEFKSFVVGGEVLAAFRGDARPWGWFAFAQGQLARTTYLGARYDDTATVADDQARRHAASVYLTWYTSEFLRFRLGYEHRFGDVTAEDGQNSLFAELNFIIGAHPTEPFWVNK